MMNNKKKWYHQHNHPPSFGPCEAILDYGFYGGMELRNQSTIRQCKILRNSSMVFDYRVLTRFLDDSGTLVDLYVNDGCLLYMEYSLMTLHVRSDVGDTRTIWVEPHYVGEVKRMINQAFPGVFPDEDGALIFDGTLLGRAYRIYGGMTLLFSEAI